MSDATMGLIEIGLRGTAERVDIRIEAAQERKDSTVGMGLLLAGDIVRNLRRAAEEIERYAKWVSDLQSGLYVTCVYCGHQYGPGETTPVSMADALKAHVEQCPKHPMSALKTANADMLALLKELWADPRAVSHSNFHPTEEWLLRARAVIAKAESMCGEVIDRETGKPWRGRPR